LRAWLRGSAVLLALGALAMWLATGASRGWTKTSVAVITRDVVTGLEGVEYRRAWLPGVDFLGAALLASAGLYGLSFLFRKRFAQPGTP
jgi:hypothetical protein